MTETLNDIRSKVYYMLNRKSKLKNLYTMPFLFKKSIVKYVILWAFLIFFIILEFALNTNL